MSASSKKKLRKEQNAAALTEKQLNEQKEAKKLKTYTWTFVIAMILVVVIAIGTVVRIPIAGAVDRGSHAINIGEYQLSTTDLSYYFVDAINDHYNQAYQMYGSYAQYFLGFTAGKPLSEQKYTASEDYETWADYFMEKGIENAKGIYGLYVQALKDGHKLTEDEQKALDSNADSIKELASLYGYSSANAYLRATYGQGANLKTYNEYYKINSIASSYYTAHSDSLEFTDADFRAYEKDKFNEYSSFTYAIYNVTVSKYLDSEKTTHTDAEKKAAQASAKADAEALAGRSFLSIDAFNTAIRLLDINKDSKNAACTEYTDVLYDNISGEDVQKWLADEKREAKDVTSITLKNTSTDEDGKEVEEITGYTIVYYISTNDNKTNLVDVRHILVKFDGGKTDSNGNTTFSDAEKQAAKDAAEAILKDWKAGDATEESFAALAEKKSEDTGSLSNGGLYEDIYPGQMVVPFNDWCFNEDRKAGDTGMVETTYGWHVMYFSETNDMTFRDMMIENDLLTDTMKEWHDELSEKITVEKVDLSRMDWDYTFG